jgi:hypothetical protein
VEDLPVPTSQKNGTDGVGITPGDVPETKEEFCPGEKLGHGFDPVPPMQQGLILILSRFTRKSSIGLGEENVNVRGRAS